MNRVRKRLVALTLSAAMLFGLFGCAWAPSSTATPQPSAMQRPEEEEAVTIRMYGYLDAPFLPFLNRLQEQFPNIRLEYEFQWDEACYDESERRMLHQDGPDFLVIRGESLAAMTEKGLLLDLTGEEFSARYHVSTMSNLNDEGRIYGLPLPTDLNCLVCNRGLLKEYGIEGLPRTVPELVEVCRALTSKGQKALITDGALYHMLLRTYWLYGPEGYDWLEEYNAGKASMTGTPAETAWLRMGELISAGGCVSKDAEATPARRTGLMQEEEYVFRVTNLSNVKYMQRVSPELEIVALPFLGETDENQWVYSVNEKSLRFFAASAELARPENAAKRDAVLEMMDWISSPEAQTLLAACGGSSISYVNDVELEQDGLMEYLAPVIAQGRLTNIGDPERGVGEAINDSVLKILAGEMKPAEAAAACDARNAAYIPPEEIAGLDEVIGRAAETIYWRKPAAVTVGSPMAQLAAEAMAAAFPQADFAFAMAKNTASTLYAGDITLGDVLTCAEGEQDSELVLVEADGAQLKAVMEMGVGSLIEPTLIVPHGIAGAGRLLYPKGLTYEADLTREQGDRITGVTLADGSPLDPEQTYTVAVSRLMVDTVTEPNFSGCQVTDTGLYLRDVLKEYIQLRREVDAPEIGFSLTGAPEPLYEMP